MRISSRTDGNGGELMKSETEQALLWLIFFLLLLLIFAILHGPVSPALEEGGPVSPALEEGGTNA
jgi:hypothetical protein